MNHCTIRKELPEDIIAVDSINRLAFAGDAEMRLVQELRLNGDLLLSMVAEIKDVVVGHIAFSRGYIDTGRDKLSSVGLGPMAVHPDHQGKGIGSCLIVESLTMLRSMGEAHCFVLGHTWLYPKFGFQPASIFGVGSVYSAGEHFMGLELKENSLQEINGNFAYSSAFDGV